MATFSPDAFDTDAFDTDAFDFVSATIITTRPGNTFTFHDVLHEQEFIDLMRGEAEGVALWAFWALGVDLSVDPVPKLTGNLELNYPHFRTAARGATTWARFAPGTSSGVRGDIQIDMQAGEAANFAL